MRTIFYILFLLVPVKVIVHASDCLFPCIHHEISYTEVNTDIYLYFLDNALAGDIQDNDSNQNLTENYLSGNSSSDLLKAISCVSLIGNLYIPFPYKHDICEYLFLDLPPPVLG